MKNNITIKSEPNGLLLVFKESMEMAGIKNNLDVLFKKAGNFFEGASVDILYTGISLTQKQEQEILLYFREKTSSDITSFLAKNIEKHESPEIDKKETVEEKKTVEVKSEIVQGNDIYRGTLRSGQIIRSDGNLVIVGDINPGAEAEANGSIVVLGSLRGRAKAGIKDGDKAFVAALNLEPVLLIIGDHIARSPDKKESSRGIKPEMAYIKDEKMVIENIKII